MAIDATDWTVAVNGDIRYSGDAHGGASPTYATVLELHRWLQGLADDDVASGDDLHDISDATSSDRSTDNIITLLNNYNIDQTAAEHLYDGSIIQNGGDDIWDGIVNYGNADVQIQVHQDGAVLANDFWNQAGAGLNPDAGQGISHRFLVQVRADGADIDGRRLIGTCRRFGETYAEFPINGTARGNNVLALADSEDLNNGTAAGTVSGWTGITVTEGYRSIDVDNDTVNENYADEWNANTPTRSINDFYERLKWLTREGTASTLHGINGELYRGITHEITYDGATNGGPVENGYLAWGTTFNYDAELASGITVGEYYTFATSGAVGQLLAKDDDGTTGFCVFAIEPGSGTVVDDDAFTRVDGTATDGATVNGTVTGAADVGGWALVIADDGVDQVWIQLLKGVAPTDNMVMYEATSAGVHDTATDGTATVNVTVTSRTISTPFVGASTGSAIIGSYGLGIETNDLTQNDKLFDLTNTQQTPPNNVTFSVNGGVVGDYLIVGPYDGAGNLDYDQLSLNTALTTDNITSVVVTEAEPDNTPATGTLRVVDNNGVHRRLEYNLISGAGPTTFTITTTDGNEDFATVNASAGNDVYLSYIDKTVATDPENFTTVFDSAQTLFVRLRDGGGTPIKTAETTASLGSGGGSATVNRIDDA